MTLLKLVIHNAPFDVGFINHEIALLAKDQAIKIDNIDVSCAILDTLKLARDNHPGQRNSLDALCRRYNINNSNRELHGALLDSEILADVYLAMTGGQTSLTLVAESEILGQGEKRRQLAADRPITRVLKASDEEISRHEDYLDMLEKKTPGQVIWRKLG